MYSIFKHDIMIKIKIKGEHKMTYDEILVEARKNIGKYCKACPECNGRACRNQIPGPGAKGIGDS